MGADTFSCTALGKNSNEAFRNAVAQAQHDYGHRGYTGTIAEKSEFVEISYRQSRDGDPQKFAYRLIDEGDERIDDKWGPAGCLDLGEVKDGKGTRRYLFFGWASS